jgi:hypothetical protein
MKTKLLLLAVALLAGGCRTLDNLRTEVEMYEIEIINGLPLRHGHSVDGSPYEEGLAVNVSALKEKTIYENPSAQNR